MRPEPIAVPHPSNQEAQTAAGPSGHKQQHHRNNRKDGSRKQILPLNHIVPVKGIDAHRQRLQRIRLNQAQRHRVLVLARMKFKGQTAFLGFIIVSQMFAPVVLLVGIYQVMQTLGLTDSIWGLTASL